jgi:hypothetical protein
MSKQENQTRTPMTKKTSQYAESDKYRATPVGEMEAWDLQWAEQHVQEERQWQEDNKNYLVD